MKIIVVTALILSLCFVYSFSCWADDPISLLKNQEFMNNVITDILKENLNGGAFKALAAGNYYTSFDPEDPKEKPIFDLIGWINYVEAHRAFSILYQVEYLDDETHDIVGRMIQQLTKTLYQIAESRFGWNKEQSDKIYDHCVSLIEARIKHLESTALKTAVAANSPQAGGKALPFRESPGVTAKIVESCAMTMMMQKPESPKTQREMLDQCLTQSGYSYTATLQSLAENGFGLQDIQNILFLVMPAGSAKQNGIELSKVYSEEEIRYLQAIKERGKLDMY